MVHRPFWFYILEQGADIQSKVEELEQLNGRPRSLKGSKFRHFAWPQRLDKKDRDWQFQLSFQLTS